MEIESRPWATAINEDKYNYKINEKLTRAQESLNNSFLNQWFGCQSSFNPCLTQTVCYYYGYFLQDPYTCVTCYINIAPISLLNRGNIMDLF